MSSNSDIPVLTDLITEEAISIALPELGLNIDQDMYAEKGQPLNQHIAAIDPELEQSIRRILDEHMELAWQEIRLAIQLSQDDNI